jgi:hypothetical protein
VRKYRCFAVFGKSLTDLYLSMGSYLIATGTLGALLLFVPIGLFAQVTTAIVPEPIAVLFFTVAIVAGAPVVGAYAFQALNAVLDSIPTA